MSPVLANPATSLLDVLRRQAAEEPHRPAFSFLDASGTETEALTRGGLDARARTVAAALQEAGAAGERALLLHPPGLGFITSFLGCLYAGTVAVPAYPPGRNRPQARLRSIAADARARVVLAPASIASGAAGLTEKVPELAGALWIATDALDPGLADAWQETALGPADPAFLQYTSGSTADPKGVVVTHGNLLHNEEAIRRAFGQSEASVVVGWLPLYHDMGLIGNVLQPLFSGSRAVLMAPLSFLQRPALWLEAISRYRATTSGGPNFAYDLCVRKVTEAEKAGLDLSGWTVAFNGAEPVRAETLERFAAAFAPCGFRREAFFPCYGLAEATLFVTGGAPGSGEVVGCGRAAPDQTVAVVDPESGALLGTGQVGEVWVAGPSVAAGYWGRPEETERTFGARLAGGGGPFLRTGDLGFLADGELFVTGRLKDLIILRGRNHYPQDFEWTAEASHPALRPGCGAAFSVDRDGEERLVILQEVERRPAGDPAEIAETVRRAVAEEHEVAVEEVVLLRSGSILKTSSGKVRRAACRAAYLAGDLTVVARTGAGRVEIPARRPDPPLPEALLAEAARVLRRAPEEIDPDVPLTSLGLDSLAAVELRNAVAERTGVVVSLQALLEGISLRSLEAASLEKDLKDTKDSKDLKDERDLSLESLQSFGSLAALLDAPGEHPLSEGQRALWFLDRLDPAAAALHLVGLARVREGIDLEALRRALALLADRHAGSPHHVRGAGRGAGAAGARPHRARPPGGDCGGGVSALRSGDGAAPPRADLAAAGGRVRSPAGRPSSDRGLCFVGGAAARSRGALRPGARRRAGPPLVARPRLYGVGAPGGGNPGRPPGRAAARLVARAPRRRAAGPRPARGPPPARRPDLARPRPRRARGGGGGGPARRGPAPRGHALRHAARRVPGGAPALDGSGRGSGGRALLGAAGGLRDGGRGTS